MVDRGRAAGRRRGRRVGNCSASQARSRSCRRLRVSPLPDAPLLGQQSGERRSPGQPASAPPQGRIDRRPGLVGHPADRPGTPVGPSPARGAVGIGPAQDPLDIQRRPPPDRRARRPRSAPARDSRGLGPPSHHTTPQPSLPPDPLALLCRTHGAVTNLGTKRGRSELGRNAIRSGPAAIRIRTPREIVSNSRPDGVRGPFPREGGIKGRTAIIELRGRPIEDVAR